jgi:hypothetical protein
MHIRQPKLRQIAQEIHPGKSPDQKRYLPFYILAGKTGEIVLIYGCGGGFDGKYYIMRKEGE